MTYALTTIIAPLALDRLHDAEARINAMGNPPNEDIRRALDHLDAGDGTHFCSLHAVRSRDIGKAYLAFEFTADGTEAQAIARIARAIGPDLSKVFALASDWRANTDLIAYLTAHRVQPGVGLRDQPGFLYVGTPGLTVGRIRSEQDLAVKVAEILEGQGEHLSALQRVEAVRAEVRKDPNLADMLETGSALPPYAPLSTTWFILRGVLSFVTTYLWPVIALVLLLGLAGGLWHALSTAGVGPIAGQFLWGALIWLIVWSLVALVALLAVVFAGYLKLRSLEERDFVEERTANPKTLQEIFRRENHYAQNHMISITQRKPGIVRWFTARLIFWAIGLFVTYVYRPGFLSDISTIHFARWITVPRTRDLLFFSNYDASWESYLEDFITKAHAGLTGVWSNSIGFPRTENLIQDGATDGERFKRYARQSMQPTRFWYCAYPTLATTAIRANAAIRLGLSGTMTEDEAASWLSNFGSAARPPSKLVSSEIQSIIFGGLGFLHHGVCLFCELPESIPDARAWLATLLPNVAFDDGRRFKQTDGTDPSANPAVVTLALGPTGLQRLGLPEQGLQTFPYAFLTGLRDDARARILGDLGDNAVDHWRWGKTAPHAALLVYGLTPEAVEALEASLEKIAAANGVRHIHRVPLKQIRNDKPEREPEPFGFRDGISQPVIRGTYKGLRNEDTNHLVEPGEFILGYPDNRGNIPPGPNLPALADPDNILPLVEPVDDFSRAYVEDVRDLGRNGSFLVIRELEQDVDAFHAYCQAEAERLKDRLPEPYDITPDFIGAKLVGRWQDGSPIIRHPYQPKHKDTHHPNNDFLFGTEDPEALRCPFGAHIRRTNPRDSFDPGSQDQIDISNRHRIIRIGRQYDPPAGAKPGLLFMCLNGDLERQFEFVQQTWVMNPSFHGLSGEQDPLLGSGDKSVCSFTIASRYGPMRLKPVPQMIVTRGGGYFFVPGKRLLDYLAKVP